MRDRRETMLVVDDTRLNRLNLEKVFSGEFYVESCGSGEEALEFLRQRQDVAVIILDVVMPEMDGFEVLRRLKADPRLSRIPVIINTSSNSRDAELTALELGAADFLRKPFDPQVARRRVKNVLAAYELERQHSIQNAQRDKIRQLRHQIELDQLTGIYSRESFCEKTAQMLRRAGGEAYVLLRFDIDRFKVVNELFGTEVGDTVLIELAHRLKELVDGRGTYGRLGADNFAACLPRKGLDVTGLTQELGARLSSQRLKYKIAVYAGIYNVDDILVPVDQMCDRANLALQTVKGSATVFWAEYNDELRNIMLMEQAIINDMYEALENRQFCVYLQPVYSTVSPRPIAAEALVRWRHPVKGMMLPGVYIPLFERNGFITKLDEYVWEEACRLISEAKSAGEPIVPISVNVSRVDLYDRDFCTGMKQLVQRYGVEPSMLKLEITESVYSDDTAQIMETTRKLQDAGFAVLMDDFGSGHSSLNMLKDVPVDVLKIDMKFMSRGENGTSRAGSVIDSVVRMAKWLGMGVVAEGVETRDQFEFLRSIGCDGIQGYYFARPMPPEEFKKLLAEQPEEQPDDRGEDEADLDFLWSYDRTVNAFLDSMAGAMGVVEAQGDRAELLRVNSGYLETFGQVNRGVLGNVVNIFDYVHPEDLPAARRAMENSRTAGESVRFIMRIMLDEGGALWQEIKLRYIGQRGGRALYFFAADNAGGKLTEERENALRRYSDVLSCVYDEIYEMDYGTRTVLPIFLGPNALGKLERTPFDDALEWKSTRMTTDDIDVLEQLFSGQWMSGGERTMTFEARVLKKDGVMHFAMVNVTRVEDAMKSTTALVCIRDMDKPKNSDRNLLDDFPIACGTWLLEDGKMLPQYANDKTRELFGVSQDEKDIPLSHKDFTWAESMIGYIEKKLVGRKHGDVFRCEIPAVTRDGKRFLLQVDCGICRNPDGPIRCCAIMRDITQLAELKQAADAKKELSRLLIEGSELQVFDFDIVTDTLKGSLKPEVGPRSDITVTSFLEKQLTGENSLLPEHREMLKGFFESATSGAANKKSGKLEFMADFFGSGHRWYRLNYTLLPGGGGKYARLIGLARDVEDEKKLEQEARIDTVSGVFNRLATQERISEQLEKRGPAEFLLFDIDNFKAVNDTYGHVAGDILLRSIADIFKRFFRDGDIVGRIGGDEFVLLTSGEISRELLIYKAKLTMQEINDLAGSMGWELPISVSVGIAGAPADGRSFEELYAAADVALYKAKAAGKNCFMFAGEPAE